MKTALVLLALLATTGTASAGGWIHAGADAAGTAHTVDLIFGNQGTVIVMVDGEPLATPEAPQLPSAPGVPALPLPEVPTPDAPATPDVPATPELPALPALPLP